MTIIAFVDTTVIPMDRERSLPHHTVVVEDGRIRSVGPADRTPAPAGADCVDGRGKYLMPGLCDIHVHVNVPALRAQPWVLPRFLAAGVTTILNLSGAPDVVQMRGEIEAGRLVGPRLHTSGPILDGDPPVDPNCIALGDPGKAREIVAGHRAAGYEMVKVYNNLSHPVYDAIMEAAQAERLPVVGHLARAVGMDDSLRAGQHIAHLEEYLYTWFASGRDEDRIRHAVEATSASGVTVIPTLGFYHNILDQATDLDGALARTRLERMPPDVTRVFWLPPNNRYANRKPEELAGFRDRLGAGYALQRDLLKRMHDAGVPIISGTDTPLPLAVPGLSLHRELYELVDIGLSPYQALATATTGPARFLGNSDKAGCILAGCFADLLLLDSDPFRDVHAVEHITGVMADGRWLPAEALQRLPAEGY